MFKFKTIPATALIALGIASSVSAKNLPTSYEVIDLGALPVVGTDPMQSSGFSINDSGDLVGTSLGEFTYTVEVNGVVTTQRVNVLNAVRFFEGGIEPQEVIPENSKSSIEAVQRGSFTSSVSGDGIVAGYRAVEQQESNYTFDDEDNTCKEELVDRIRSRAYYDNGNFNEIMSFIRSGEPLDDSIVEFTDTSVLDISGNLMVGKAEVVTEKSDDCNNVTPTSTSTRGMIYNTSTGNLQTVDLFDVEHNQSTITSVNNNGTFIGQSSLFDFQINFYRSAVAFIGSDANSLESIVGLENSAIDTFWSINDNGSYAVGGSGNSLFNFQAFYYDVGEKTSIGIGFLDEQFRFSQSLSVNNDNLIVGISQVTSTPRSYAPFIYDIDAENPTPVNLNTLIDCDSGWYLAEAREINNQGWIIGSGTVTVEQQDGTFEGEVRAFLLKPRTTEADQGCETTEAVETAGSINGIGLLFLTIFVVYRRYPNFS